MQSVKPDVCSSAQSAEDCRPIDRQSSKALHRSLGRSGRWEGVMKSAVLLAFAALTFAATAAPAPTPAAAPQVKGVLISDIHFDPLAEKALVPQLIQADLAQWDAILQKGAQKEFSPYGSDVNYALMTSALEQAAKKSRDGIVIFTGDLLRHDFDEAFTAAGGTKDQYPVFAVKTAAFTVRKMQQTFKTPVVIALGNNDTDAGDYALPPHSPFLAALAKEISVVENAQDAAVRRDFEYGGFYAIPNPNVPLQYLVVLNTIFWSTHYVAPAGIEDPGKVELEWLEAKLKLAKDQAHHVSLIMHIPPGFDAYIGAKTHKGQLLWKEDFEYRFLALIAQYSDMVTLSFAGHTHMDDFRIIRASSVEPLFPIRVNPAVSPMFHNNPAFATFTYHPTLGDIRDITTFFLPLSEKQPKWKTEYQFSKTYGYRAYSADALADLSQKIRKDKKTFENYQKLYDVSSKPYPITVDPLTWPYFACTQTSFTTDVFDACIADQSREPDAPLRKR